MRVLVGAIGAGVDRVRALDLVARIACVRDGSAGRERGDGGKCARGVRRGHGVAREWTRI